MPKWPHYLAVASNGIAIAANLNTITIDLVHGRWQAAGLIALVLLLSTAVLVGLVLVRAIGERALAARDVLLEKYRAERDTAQLFLERLRAGEIQVGGAMVADDPTDWRKPS